MIHSNRQIIDSFISRRFLLHEDLLSDSQQPGSCCTQYHFLLGLTETGHGQYVINGFARAHRKREIGSNNDLPCPHRIHQMSQVLGRIDQRINYRCNWATADGLAAALADRENFNTSENADMRKLKASRGMWIAVKTMWTGGFLALWDFVIALPKLAKRHKLVDQYYARYGKFKQQPGDPPPGEA